MLAAVWLAVASTMKEPPYVSSLRIEIPANIAANEALKVRLLETEGIKSVDCRRRTFSLCENRQQSDESL